MKLFSGPDEQIDTISSSENEFVNGVRNKRTYILFEMIHYVAIRTRIRPEQKENNMWLENINPKLGQTKSVW